MRRIFHILLMSLVLVACERSVTDYDGGGKDVIPSGVGNGVRPGIGLPTDADVMLGDNVPRYISPRRTLRGDEPGILVARDSDGNYYFVNLDKRERVDIFIGPQLTGMKIVECGNEIRPDEIAVIGDDGSTRWIVAKSGDEAFAIVLPYF